MKKASEILRLATQPKQPPAPVEPVTPRDPLQDIQIRKGKFYCWCNTYFSPAEARRYAAWLLKIADLVEKNPKDRGGSGHG